MYPENPEGTQVIKGSMNMGYISDTARNRTHNLFHQRTETSVITCITKFQHITPWLKKLNWLPVKQQRHPNDYFGRFGLILCERRTWVVQKDTTSAIFKCGYFLFSCAALLKLLVPMMLKNKSTNWKKHVKTKNIHTNWKTCVNWKTYVQLKIKYKKKCMYKLKMMRPKTTNVSIVRSI